LHQRSKTVGYLLKWRFHYLFKELIFKFLKQKKPFLKKLNFFKNFWQD